MAEELITPFCEPNADHNWGHRASLGQGSVPVSTVLYFLSIKPYPVDAVVTVLPAIIQVANPVH